MKILVLNCGSSSLKYQLIDMETDNVLASGKYVIGLINLGEFLNLSIFPIAIQSMPSSFAFSLLI